jgi:hypothetical protein
MTRTRTNALLLTAANERVVARDETTAADVREEHA